MLARQHAFSAQQKLQLASKAVVCSTMLADYLAVLGDRALLIPFFGPINSVMGAFFTTFASYIIPGVAYIWAFRKVRRPPSLC